MNYRHVYHAGNFADVLKHAVVAAIVVYLQRKEAAFRVIDTHAGPGTYNLTSEKAQKTGEWLTGIGKLNDVQMSNKLKIFLEPWLSAVKAVNNGSDKILKYPGSPQLVRHLMRKQDRLSAFELHPEDAQSLKSLFTGDHQVRVTELDGWLSMGAHLPPKEKRGLVLVDPPFEEAGEFDRMMTGLFRAGQRFPRGTYCFWYPIKVGSDSAGFHQSLRDLCRAETLACELWVRDRKTPTGLNGSGLVIVNPPFTLEAQLSAIMPELSRLLAQEQGAGFLVKKIVAEGKF